MAKRSKTCKQVILDQFKAKPVYEWTPKVDFFQICYLYGHSPESCGRQLRLMEQNGEIKVSYYDGQFAKGLAMYSLNGELPKKPQIIIKDGVAYVH